MMKIHPMQSILIVQRHLRLQVAKSDVEETNINPIKTCKAHVDISKFANKKEEAINLRVLCKKG